MKKLIALVLCLVSVLVLFSSCGKKENTVLFMGVDTVAGVLDPQIVSDSAGITIVRNCFEGLVRIGADGSILPGVAEKWTVSPDGLTYTFNLRPDAEWHLTSNAQEAVGEKLPENFSLKVTSYDFAFALRRAVDPATASPQGFMLMNIKGAREIMEGSLPAGELGVETPDEHTLIIHLAVAQRNLTEILAEPMCMPCNETFFNACSGRYGRYIKYYLSNGPFYLSRLNEDSWRINANPDYHGSAPVKSEAVWLYYNPDRASVIENFKDGTYSCALLSSFEYENASLSSKVTVQSSDNVLRAFIMNLNDEILANRNIRKALTAATDNALAAQNAGMVPTSGVVPSCAAENMKSHPSMYDESSAKNYLNAGLKELGRSSVTVEILCEQCYEDMSKRLVQQWQRILGVDIGITIRLVTRDELESEVKKGNYQISFSSVSSQTDKCYEYFASFAPTSPYNSTGYTDELIPDYLSRLYAGGQDSFSTVYLSIEDSLVTASFMIPLWEESTYFVSNEAPDRITFCTGADKIYFS